MKKQKSCSGHQKGALRMVLAENQREAQAPQLYLEHQKTDSERVPGCLKKFQN